MQGDGPADSPYLAGRLGEGQDPVFQRLNTSLGFDQRLWEEDLAGSRAHLRLLAAIGILSAEEREKLERGLEQVGRELAEGTFPFQQTDEDIHMAVERRLAEVVGEVAGKLHTGRSRNDQVVTDLLLHVRGRARQARYCLAELLSVLLARAEEHRDWPAPGYTHLQRAQPLYLGHHLLAYFWMFARDERRFWFVEEGCRELPLGAGALAGSGFGEDRTALAKELGFAAVAPNSLDAVSNRDFVLDYLGAAATTATHLSRLGGELVLWASAEFGFVELADAWSATSSLMPQKKNPDAAELLRAKAPRVVGHLGALHGVLHGLPLGYHKDLQEDKEHLFDAADTLELCLAAGAGLVRTASFRKERLAAAARDPSLAATEVADLLVKGGVPFREAHRVVGRLVREALAAGKGLGDLSAKEIAACDPLLAAQAEEVVTLLADPQRWLESKRSQGGTASERLAEQLEQAKDHLQRLREELDGRPGEPR